MTAQLTLNSGRVTRYHANPQLTRLLQTNGDHQWAVSVVVLTVHPSCRKELLLHALLHDAGELRSGDLPAGVKRKNPVLAQEHRRIEAHHSNVILRGVVDQMPLITDFEHAVLKFADVFESVHFILTFHHDPAEVDGFIDAVDDLCQRMTTLRVMEEHADPHPEIYERARDLIGEFVDPKLDALGIHRAPF